MRLKIFILSTMLITLISGVLFYKNLTQISAGKTALKLDLDELRSINLQMNNTAYFIRKNINSDLTDLHEESARVKELIALVNDINKNAPELKASVIKIRGHFEKKIIQMEKFELAIKDLRASVNSLVPTYNELDKKNIKFVLDKKDFYRECVLDAYMYLSFSHKENEARILEDQKVLSQIISYAETPNLDLQKFSKHIDVIHGRVKEIDYYLADLKEDTIAPDVKVIAKYYQDSVEEQNEQNENLLTFMFAAIAIYMGFVIFILRKT
jgi:hypothetical protein